MLERSGAYAQPQAKKDAYEDGEMAPGFASIGVLVPYAGYRIFNYRHDNIFPRLPPVVQNNIPAHKVDARKFSKKI